MDFLFDSIEKRFRDNLGKSVLGVERSSNYLSVDLDNPNVLEKKWGQYFGSISFRDKPNYIGLDGDIPVAKSEDDYKAKVYDVIKGVTDIKGCVVSELHPHKYSVHVHVSCEIKKEDADKAIESLVNIISKEFGYEI